MKEENENKIHRACSSDNKKNELERACLSTHTDMIQKSFLKFHLIKQSDNVRDRIKPFLKAQGSSQAMRQTKFLSHWLLIFPSHARWISWQQAVKLQLTPMILSHFKYKEDNTKRLKQISRGNSTYVLYTIYTNSIIRTSIKVLI